MRRVIILCVACALMSFTAVPAKADDVSELKQQLQALQEQANSLTARIQGLESKQESQAKEIKKVPDLVQKVTDLKEGSRGQLTDGLSIGGHVKLFMADRTTAKHNGDEQHTNLSAGVGTHAFILYVTKQLEDWLKLDTATDFGVSASATPTIGSSLTRAYNTSVGVTLRALNLQALLPQGYELKVGIFNPMFSEEFSKETFGANNIT